MKNIETLQLPAGDLFTVQGDTIDEIELSFSQGVDFTTHDVKMQLYFNERLVLDVSKGNGITVVDALNIKIDAIKNNTFPVGVLVGDLRIKDADGNIKTYYRIEYTILKKYTEWT